MHDEITHQQMKDHLVYLFHHAEVIINHYFIYIAIQLKKKYTEIF